MRRPLIAALALLLLTAVPALAEDATWRADDPKQGTADFMLCTGYAEAAGHSYRNSNFIPNEIVGNCDRYAREDTARYFRFHHGIEIDPSIVKVTVSKP